MAKTKQTVLMDLSKVFDFGDEEHRDITDSVGYAKKYSTDHEKSVLFQAHRCYDGWQQLREEHQRCKDYANGHQWRDKITIDGETMTEEQYLIKQGMVPLSNNMIQRMIRNIVGVYRSQNKEVTCTSRDRDEQPYCEAMSTMLQYVNQNNNTNLLNARSLHVGLISGFVCHKHTFGWRDGRFDAWIDKVDINNFAGDSNATDYAGKDFSMLVELHQMPFGKLCATFAHSPEDVQALKSEYSSQQKREFIETQFREFGMRDSKINYDFFIPQSPELCRVIEVWNKETRKRLRCWDKGRGERFDIDEKDRKELVDNINAERLKEAAAAGMPAERVAKIEVVEWYIEEYWYYRFYTPFGHVLLEGETPYAHGGHPYNVFMYPFIDGEIHSLVHDMIPLQKLINRIQTEYDWIIRSSAKGVLLYPEGAFDGYDMEEVAKLWSSPNGVLPYKAKAGVAAPNQVSTNSTNIGIAEQLSTTLHLFEDVSGVNGALQGKAGYSTTSGTLYAQQAQNSANSLLDILESFSSFLVEGAYKDVANIQQFYDDERIMEVVGKDAMSSGNADAIRNIRFDLSVIESQTSGAYREVMNAYLTELWQQGQISVKQLLKHGSFPFADKLLQDMDAQELQQQQAMQQQEAAMQNALPQQ